MPEFKANPRNPTKRITKNHLNSPLLLLKALAKFPLKKLIINNNAVSTQFSEIPPGKRYIPMIGIVARKIAFKDDTLDIVFCDSFDINNE